MSEAVEPGFLAEEPEADEVVINLATKVDPLMAEWSRFRDQFAEGMDGGFWTIEDLEQKIAHRRAFFFPGANAALVGHINVYPGGRRTFETLWATGDPAEIVAMAPGVEAVARMMGCDSMLIEGRPAWLRLLRSQGYEPWSQTIFKAL